jgi:hypothetical protein
MLIGQVATGRTNANIAELANRAMRIQNVESMMRFTQEKS